MEKINQKEEEILKEFRERIGDKVPLHLNSDFELSKWLIARNFNINKAETMLLKHLEWRKEYNIDNILEWTPPEVLRKYCPGGLAGYDKDGAPVVIIPIGSMDVRGVKASSSNEDILKYIFQIVEKSLDLMRRKSRDLEQPIGKEIFIFDLNHFSLRDFTWTPAINLVLKLVQMYEANYPEILKHAFAINAPKVFSVLFSIIKPFIQTNTMKRIKIFGKNEWKEVLLKEIDADQLPVHWGGSMTDPDGNTQCVSTICPGGEVPKEYYLKKKLLKQEAQNLPFDFILPRNETKIFQFQIEENAGSELRWEFRSRGADIGYEVTRNVSEGEEKLIPMERANSQVFKEEGAIVCDEKGIYKIIFKNEYSDKDVEVFYNIDLHSSEEHSSRLIN
ncbi:UNVERIFIED_CONTAM: hypothetical protein RMT77_013452 [Armadillidium vulgare]